MKIIDLQEAPIGDYATIGNWGDKEKSNSFRHAQDRKIIQSNNLIKKVRKKFGNTEHVLNFYFINLPGVAKFAEYGMMTSEELSEYLPKAWELVQQREKDQSTDAAESINILFVGNAGVNRVPMTAWIMAHRIGHVMQSAASRRHDGMRAWQDFEDDFFESLRSMLDQVYDWKINKTDLYTSKPLAKFYEAIGSMASARNGNLGGRPYEFLYELFAQYVTTGKLTFRELPTRFGTRGSIYAVRNDAMEDARQTWSEELTSGYYGIHNQWEDRMDTVLYGATGKYMVM